VVRRDGQEPKEDRNMHRNSALERLVDRAGRHWDASRRSAPASPASPHPAAHPFTIALSREAGTPDLAVAEELGRRLHWPVYGHELLERIAEDMGLRASLLEGTDERRRRMSWFSESLESLLQLPPVSHSAYVHRLIEIVIALGVHGECIIVGRGAAHILPPETSVRVRLVAPRKERVGVLARQLGIPAAEAARKVEMLDRERSRFVRDHLLKDTTDPAAYDLVLNAGRFSIGQLAGLVEEALGRMRMGAAESQHGPQMERHDSGEALQRAAAPSSTLVG
jgi:cytidylate kinase